MNLEFFIRMRDMMSSGLVKMAGTVQRTSATIRGVNGTLAQSYDTIRTKINQLEQSINRSTSIKHIREARRELDSLNRLAARAPGNTTGGGTGFLGGILRQALPMLGVAGILGLGGSVIGSGLDAQARQASFEVMAGKGEGSKLNADLTKYAQDGIYGNEVYQNAQTMMAFGIAPKEVMGDMKMLGDIAMGNKDRMGRLALAYSQVAAAGKLMGQDLIQFVNAGFNPLKIISDRTGISLGSLRKSVEQGQVSFEQIKAAFTSATSAGGEFFEMTKTIEGTAFGKWEAFKGQMQGLAMQIGTEVAPAFGNLISNYLAPFVKWMSEGVVWIKENWGWIGMLAASLGTAIVAYQSVVLVIKQWSLAQETLNVIMSMNPIGLLVAAIAALVIGVIWAWNNFEGFRNTVLSLWEVMKVLWNYVKEWISPAIQAITFQFQLWKIAITGLWDVVKYVFDKMANYFQVVFAPIIEGIKWLFNAASTSIGNSSFGKDVANAWNRGQSEHGASSTWGGVTPSSMAADSGSVSGIWDSLKGGKTNAEADNTARGIAGGGPRVININGVKFTDKIEIHTATIGESVTDMEAMLQEMFLRVLNSGAAIQ
jgi:tape measure domain-containing protein